MIERLGKANIKPRQLLKYHNDHHVKVIGRRIATDGDLQPGAEGDSEEAGHDENDYYNDSEAPTDMRITVSTVYGNGSSFSEVEAINLDSRSETGFLQLLMHHLLPNLEA